MIAAISPADINYDETLSTLRYKIVIDGFVIRVLFYSNTFRIKYVLIDTIFSNTGMQIVPNKSFARLSLMKMQMLS